jgi:hypothetical protein
MSLALLGVFMLRLPFGLKAFLLPALLLSLLAAIVEALSPKGWDNYLIPLAVLVGILLMARLTPGLWPFPVFAF